MESITFHPLKNLFHKFSRIVVDATNTNTGNIFNMDYSHVGNEKNEFGYKYKKNKKVKKDEMP